MEACIAPVLILLLTLLLLLLLILIGEIGPEIRRTKHIRKQLEKIDKEASERFRDIYKRKNAG